MSPIPDEKALATRCSLNGLELHPCLCLSSISSYSSCTSKIHQSQCKVLLIAPLWPNRSWFPELLNLLISPPVTFPVISDLLEQLQGRLLHQNPQLLSLHAWKLLNNPSEIESFQRKLQTMSLKLEEFWQERFMMQSGRCLPIGQIRGKLILSRPNVTADFLIYLSRDKNCQVSLISYRSMISNTLKFRSKMNIGKHPIISELIKSFQMQRPVWDLAFVLTYLCKDLFDPMNSSSLFYWSIKTSFQLTKATARYVCEIHAFAIDEDHFRFSSVDSSLTLRTQIGFLAKNQLPDKAPESIWFQGFQIYVSHDSNHLLCQIRAVKIYLKKMKSIWGSRTRPFIPTKRNRDIKKSTIFNWVKFTIKIAYQSISKRQMPHFKVRAHELRARSSSWAHFNFIPLDEIIKAGVWSSSSFFAKFYQRFSETKSKSSSLGPICCGPKSHRGPENLAP